MLLIRQLKFWATARSKLGDPHFLNFSQPTLGCFLSIDRDPHFLMRVRAAMSTKSKATVRPDRDARAAGFTQTEIMTWLLFQPATFFLFCSLLPSPKNHQRGQGVQSILSNSQLDFPSFSPHSSHMLVCAIFTGFVFLPVSSRAPGFLSTPRALVFL